MNVEFTDKFVCSIALPEKMGVRRVRQLICEMCFPWDQEAIVGTEYGHEDTERKHHYTVTIHNIQMGRRYSIMAALRKEYDGNFVLVDDDGCVGESEEDEDDDDGDSMDPDADALEAQAAVNESEAAVQLLDEEWQDDDKGSGGLGIAV